MTLFVPDLSEARKFYADVFGLEAQPMDEDTAMLRFGGMAVFLHKAAAAAQPLPEILEEAQKGAGQFVIIVGDVDAVCAEIASRGVWPLSGPANREWGMRTATFADLPGQPSLSAQGSPKVATLPKL
jgi:catechol 2,3-dioxygenase-like lactoylglutathione lyase family enzyme